MQFRARIDNIGPEYPPPPISHVYHVVAVDVATSLHREHDAADEGSIIKGEVGIAHLKAEDVVAIENDGAFVMNLPTGPHETCC